MNPDLRADRIGTVAAAFRRRGLKAILRDRLLKGQVKQGLLKGQVKQGLLKGQVKQWPPVCHPERSEGSILMRLANNALMDPSLHSG